VVWSRFTHRKLLRRGAPGAVGAGWFGCVPVEWGVPAHLGRMAADRRNANAGANPWGLDPLLSVGELAAYLGVPVSTVYDWRTGGRGPVAHRLGKHLKFALSDVRAWVEAQREMTPGPGRQAGSGRGVLVGRQRLGGTRRSADAGHSPVASGGGER
jgi:excisionase family DNA binding protein